jgi:hypothetical protein
MDATQPTAVTDPSDPNMLAMARWIRALNERGALPLVTEAVHDECRIERCGLGEHAGRVVEEIIGREAIARWMALSPPGTEFRLVGAPEAVRDADGTGFAVAYAIRVEDFENGGRWRFRLGPCGELMWLKHVPQQIAAATVGEVRDPAETWRRYTVPLPTHTHATHQHGPDCDHGCDHG